MEGKISVIVPIYKVERYLPACIDSIFAQTHTDLEIILVDDGSPDGCPAICDDYAARDSRIVVIHQKNGGVAAARNRGLDAATGEYIGFVDADDMVAPQMYAHLLAVLQEKGADLASCALAAVAESAAATDAAPTATGELFWFSREASVGLALGLDDRIGGLCTDKLYRSTLLRNMRFDETLSVSEDRLFLMQVLLAASGIWYCTAPLCLHRARPDSLTRSAFGRGQFSVVQAGVLAAELAGEQLPQLYAESRAYLAAVSLYIVERVAGDRALRRAYRPELNATLRLLRGLPAGEIAAVKGRKFALYLRMMRRFPTAGHFLYFKVYCAILGKA